MESKLILVHHKEEMSKELIAAETKCIFQLLAASHSFETFLTAYERFDVKRHKTITQQKECMKLYYALTLPAFQFVIGKN